jgi:hypothetical protein
VTNSLPSSLAHSSIVYNNYLWAIGGENARTLRSSDGANWSTLVFPGVVGYGVATCVHNGRLYFSGGIAVFNTDASTGVYSTTDGVTWTTHRVHGDSGSFTGRANHQMYSIGGRLFIGGGNTNLGVSTPDLWYSDDDGTTWTLQGVFSYNLNRDSTINVYDVLYMINSVASVLYYSFNGYDWTSDSITGPSTRSSFGFGYDDGKLYIVGGSSGASFPVNTSYSAPLPYPYHSSTIEFTLNNTNSPSPAYLRITDESEVYDLDNDLVTEYTRVWGITDNSTSATTYYETSASSLDFSVSGVWGTTFSISLSAVF